MSHTIRNWSAVAAFCLVAPLALADPAAKTIVREALEAACRKSGRTIAKESASVAERTLERNVATFGNRALTAASDGGLELIEAMAKYGDDVMRLAVDASPSARRAFALNAETLLPLARRVGPEALEVEAKVPGHAGRIFASFGDDAGKIIAKSVPAEDLPRLLAYAEKADSQATRELLLRTYQKEGKTLFERIPPRLVLVGGLTAAMLYGTHRITKPINDALASNPTLVRDVLNHSVTVFGTITGLVIFLVLWRFGLVPWHRKPRGTVAVPPSSMPKPEDNGNTRPMTRTRSENHHAQLP